MRSASSAPSRLRPRRPPHPASLRRALAVGPAAHPPAAGRLGAITILDTLWAHVRRTPPPRPCRATSPSSPPARAGRRPAHRLVTDAAGLRPARLRRCDARGSSTSPPRARALEDGSLTRARGRSRHGARALARAAALPLRLRATSPRGDPAPRAAASRSHRGSRRRPFLRCTTASFRALGSLVAAHPLRERLRGQWMLALYRRATGDALEAYRDGRRLLAPSSASIPAGAAAARALHPRAGPAWTRRAAALAARGNPPLRSRRPPRPSTARCCSSSPPPRSCRRLPGRAPAPRRWLSTPSRGLVPPSCGRRSAARTRSSPGSPSARSRRRSRDVRARLVGDAEDGTVDARRPEHADCRPHHRHRRAGHRSGGRAGSVWQPPEGSASVARIDPASTPSAARIDLHRPGDPVVPASPRSLGVAGRRLGPAPSRPGPARSRSDDTLGRHIRLGHSRRCSSPSSAATVWSTLVHTARPARRRPLGRRLPQLLRRHARPGHRRSPLRGCGWPAPTTARSGKLDPLTRSPRSDLARRQGTARSATALEPSRWISFLERPHAVRVDRAHGRCGRRSRCPVSPQDLSSSHDGLVWVALQAHVLTLS